MRLSSCLCLLIGTAQLVSGCSYYSVGVRGISEKISYDQDHPNKDTESQKLARIGAGLNLNLGMSPTVSECTNTACYFERLFRFFPPIGLLFLPFSETKNERQLDFIRLFSFFSPSYYHDRRIDIRTGIGIGLNMSFPGELEFLVSADYGIEYYQVPKELSDGNDSDRLCDSGRWAVGLKYLNVKSEAGIVRRGGHCLHDIRGAKGLEIDFLVGLDWKFPS